MKLFREYLKNYKWYLFPGDAKSSETKVLINSKEEGWLERGQYFQAIALGDRKYKINYSGNTGWNRRDIVFIDNDELLKFYDSEKEAQKYSELVFGGWNDPEGDNFDDLFYDRLSDIGIVHK